MVTLTSTATILAVLLLAGADAPADLKGEVEQFRAKREARLRAEDGWLSVAGLFWLQEGENSCGSKPGSRVLLPKGAPERVGSFLRRGQEVSIRIEPGVSAALAGRPVESAVLRVNHGDDVVRLGRLSLSVIERGGEIGVRLKDNDSPARTKFKGLSWFPIGAAYRVVARFEPNPPGATVDITNVLGQTQKLPCPGVAVFRLGGRELRLSPVLEEPNAKELFFIFRDRTASKETYGAGRFLYSELPRDGEVVLDFNKAYSPPCAFTRYATCPLPPKRNQLPVRIEAGEKFASHD
jgi:uncharacterized protein (DUF1684 family)